MKNIIEYIQLQTTLDDEHMQECYGCSKTLRVSAYCFKCNDFLCKACHQFHVTSKITKDHRQHTLAVEDVASKRLTLDKLASLKEAPRCYTHSEKLSELCCKTCSNTPICMACTYGNHEGHDFREVTALANEERRKLGDELAELLSHEDKIMKMPEKLKNLEDQIETIVSEKQKVVLLEHTDKKQKIEEKIQMVETKYKLSKDKQEENLNKEISLLQREMEGELQKVREKYKKLCDEKKQQTSRALQFTKQEHDDHVLKLREKLSILNTGCKEATESLRTQQQGNIQKAQTIGNQYESMIKRFENLKATTTTLLESMNDWTVLQCIPDILSAKKPLMEELKKETPELKTLTDIKMERLPNISLSNRVSVTTQSVMTIEGISCKTWDVCDITTTQNGYIVVTGNAGVTGSHITVIDTKGKVVQEMRQLTTNYKNPDCFCDFLSGSKFVTACDPRELGIYDTNGMQHTKVNVSAVTPEWPPERGVTCVASDIKKDLIFLGNYQCRHLYAFDGLFQLSHKLILPKPLIGCHDVVVFERNLIVCDFIGRMAIAMNMESEMVCEFKQPAGDLITWGPIQACADSNGFVYILWCNDPIGYSGDRVITQNRLDVNHVLAVIPVDKDAFSLTTIDSLHEERLLVATLETGKIYCYNLVPED